MTEQLLGMLRACILAEPYGGEIPDAQAAEALYRIGKQQDLAHLLAYVLQEQLGVRNEAFEKELMTAIYRQTRLDAAAEQIGRALEAAGIPYVPLKGAVLRAYYPERWMRTSCDIDILVQEQTVRRAARLLSETLGYRVEASNYHDISLYSPAGVHLELHFSLCENRKRMDRVLERAWEHAHPVEENGLCLAFDDTFLLFHLIAHTAYHFQGGGCGLRPLLDLQVLQGKIRPDRERLDAFLQEAGLVAFYGAVEQLLAVWFADGTHSELTERMQEYLLGSGLYGAREIGILNSCLQKKSRSRYLRERIFPPYSYMKPLYPAVRVFPPLLPFFWGVRLVKGVFAGKLPSRMQEFKQSKSFAGTQAEAQKQMLLQLDLLDE